MDHCVLVHPIELGVKYCHTKRNCKINTSQSQLLTDLQNYCESKVELSGGGQGEISSAPATY